MESHEALQRCIAGRTLEQAKALHLCKSSVIKWQEPHEDYTDSGSYNPLDRLKTTITKSLELGIQPKDALAPLYWLAEQFNHISIPVPPAQSCLSELHSDLLKTIKEFGDLAAAASEALGDGKISRKEAEKINREGWELIRQTGIFLKTVKESTK